MRMVAVVAVLALGLAALAGLASVTAQLDPEVDPVGTGDSGGIPGGSPTEVVTEPAFSYGVAIGAAAVGMGAWLMFRGGAKIVTKDNVLENDTRAELYEFLEEKPGTHLRAIADDLDLSTTNVLWHLRKLEDADLVRSEKQGGYKVYYLMEGGQAGKREALAQNVLRNDNASTILEYISSNPGSHQRAIARALDVNHGTVRWHLKKMLDTDLLLQVKRDHSIQYFLTDLGATMVGGQATAYQASASGEGEPAPA